LTAALPTEDENVNVTAVVLSEPIETVAPLEADATHDGALEKAWENVIVKLGTVMFGMVIVPSLSLPTMVAEPYCGFDPPPFGRT
jgi:hypothetical protein